MLAHTTEQFLINPNIEKVFVAVPNDWLTYTENLLSNEKIYGFTTGKIHIIVGGSDRNGSLMAAVNKIDELYSINNDDIIISHDAVRPFLTQRIINDNIEMCKIYNAVDTVYTLADTPVISENGETIQEIPVRSKILLGQTPQTFNIQLLKDVYTSLTDDEKTILTDACKMFVIKNKTVRIVMGESYNMKITTPFDYAMALAFIKEEVTP